MPNPKRKLRKYRGGSDAVSLYLSEAESLNRPDRTTRQTAILGLRFFEPINPELRTLEALTELKAEFGSELPEHAWINRRIAELEEK